ncbi:hypothetical protein [Tropicimonas sp. IMCC6043]|uniref:hypothetical protein n=1 Tax=Tropicimonas sp. IMCC6043 TaxID=2510645 RepID=UPI00101CC562|nr:hypothetical protein [Tropicimonas sp. IMCC6043]
MRPVKHVLLVLRWERIRRLPSGVTVTIGSYATTVSRIKPPFGPAFLPESGPSDRMRAESCARAP